MISASGSDSKSTKNGTRGTGESPGYGQILLDDGIVRDVTFLEGNFMQRKLNKQTVEFDQLSKKKK